MGVTASILVGPGSAGVAAAAAATVVLVRLRWEVAVGAAVAADVLTWSWLRWLEDVGNILYWGVVLGIGAALLLEARTSTRVRRLLALTALASIVLAATAAWSIAPHATLRECATFASALVVVILVAVRVNGSGEQLVDALAIIVPASLLLSVAVIVGDHARAVAEGGGVSGFVNGANALGIVLALASPFLFCTRALRDRAVAVAVASGTVAFVVALSGSRTGLLAFALGLATVEVGARHWRMLAIGAAAVGAGTLLAVVWTPAIPTLGRPLSINVRPGVQLGPGGTAPMSKPQARDFLGGRVGGQSEFGALTGARNEAWDAAVHLLSRAPLRGTGFGTGDDIFLHYGVRDRFTNFVGAFDPHANVHQSYLQELLELGFPLGLLFLALPIVALVVAVRRLAEGQLAPAEAALAGVVVAATVSALFESVFAGFGPMTLLAWLGAGGFLAASRARRVSAVAVPAA